MHHVIGTVPTLPAGGVQYMVRYGTVPVLMLGTYVLGVRSVTLVEIFFLKDK
ncbi:hypothetical protein CYLTODRAFT_271376 [Cylindrobasidium torrendii FP15055 ss-10]|uniref:Uncharacterized protein n=1 Tax=Cylindrobasidium torrendii FP15055 ss-10 TaxID=1314674 RepID=A0A0D7BSE1_9AGAR|nr:hypothetical protein CYLTODRAFT_271376 [Cylindrobasidium torrendii FP15055 ss-10]